MTPLDRLLGREMPLDNDPWSAAAGTAAMRFREQIERFCLKLTEELDEEVLSAYTMDLGIILLARSGKKAMIMLIDGSLDNNEVHITTCLERPHQEALAEIFSDGSIAKITFLNAAL